MFPCAQLSQYTQDVVSTSIRCLCSEVVILLGFLFVGVHEPFLDIPSRCSSLLVHNKSTFYLLSINRIPNTFKKIKIIVFKHIQNSITEKSIFLRTISNAIGFYPTIYDTQINIADFDWQSNNRNLASSRNSDNILSFIKCKKRFLHALDPKK